MEKKNRQLVYENMLQHLNGLKSKQNYSQTKLIAKKETSQSSNYGSLTNRINSLIQKREQHEQRIQKLLSAQAVYETTKCSNIQNSNECSQILRMFEECIQGQSSAQKKEEPGKFHSSTFCQLENHVNLLASISQKTYHELPQLNHKGKLYISLLKEFPNYKIQIKNQFKIDLSQFQQQSFRQIINYFQQNELWEGLIRQKLSMQSFFQKNQYQMIQIKEYFGTIFSNGKYEQLFLSEEEVTEEESNFIIFYEKTRNGQKGDQTEQFMNIGCLLLKRLLAKGKNISLIQDQSLPIFLNLLFSYPIHRFSVQQTRQFLQLGEFITKVNSGHAYQPQKFVSKSKRHIQEVTNQSNIILYGYKKKTQESFLIQELQKNKNLKNYSKILHKFDEIIAVEESQLQVKSISLQCHSNHHVVLTLCNFKGGKCYFNVASHRKASIQFKVCVLDSQGSIVAANILKSGNFIMLFLQNDDYQLYLSPIQSKIEENILETSCKIKKQQIMENPIGQEIQSFTFWIQGPTLQDRDNSASFQLKLVEKYNFYSSFLVNKYREAHSFAIQSMDSLILGLTNSIKIKGKQQNPLLIQSQSQDKIQSKQIENEANCCQVEVIRYQLDFLGFCVDKIICKNTVSLIVKYKENAFCDMLFNKKQILIDFGLSINSAEIILNKNVDIQSICLTQNTKDAGRQPLVFSFSRKFI